MDQGRTKPETKRSVYTPMLFHLDVEKGRWSDWSSPGSRVQEVSKEETGGLCLGCTVWK